MEDFVEVVKEIATAISPAALEAIRIKVLGRRGTLTLAMRELGRLNPEERRGGGGALNLAKDEITAALAEAKKRLRRRAKTRPTSCRCHAPGTIRRNGADPSDQPDHRRNRCDLWRDGFRVRRRTAYRRRFLQLYRPQHSARAPGATGARHVLPAGAV